MFAGLGPTLIRAVPVSGDDPWWLLRTNENLTRQTNMVIFLTFEACTSALSWDSKSWTLSRKRLW
jgi:hypothetical protein